ncbi:unnamed protein product [Moneuplotes crassus]|uniref:Arrestin-like N-terminal domain-containing protein n=1 Tax=Euplotes crassus TaxID=5936 RepID=A0AAD1UFK1_EUPCR|nr:unnamed protein product [Moneuplotes crassus]
MGASDTRSRFDYGNIYLQLDHPYAVSGTNMTGYVYLHLTHHFPATSVLLELRGDEKCKWTEQRTHKETFQGDQKTYKYNHYHNCHRIVVHQRFCLYNFGQDGAPPGDYTFPFNIPIPFGCPSSAYFSGTDCAFASIKYSIKAILQPNAASWLGEVTFKQNLIVREKAPASSDNISASINTNVKSCCCCCSKGSVSLETKFEKDAVASNEICRAMCQIKNQCSLPIQQIKICIKQFTQLKSESGIYKRSREIGSREFDGVQAREDTDGFSKLLQIPLNELESKMSHQLFYNFDPVYRDEVGLVNFIQPTTSGLHLNITYLLEVKLIYKIRCGKMPKTSIPLFIHAPEIEGFTIIKAPEDWNPTTYNESNYETPLAPIEMAQKQVFNNIAYNPAGMGMYAQSQLVPGGRAPAYVTYTAHSQPQYPLAPPVRSQLKPSAPAERPCSDKTPLLEPKEETKE